MIVVTHLLGAGHLSRSVTLAKGLQDRGFDVVIVSGGMAVPHIDLAGLRLRPLPAVRSDGVVFSRLLDETGAPVTPDFMARRTARLIGIFGEERPDFLITELFPFGRRMLRAEFTALLEAARAARTCTAASVRDILNPPSKPEKAAWADEMVERYYDLVLVHADKRIVSLAASWPLTPALKARLSYTGFVAPPPAGAHPDGAGRGEVLVSAGGGAVGMPLFETARAAAQLDRSRIWRLLVGGRDAEARIAELAIGAPANVVVESVRPDFRQMLHGAAASVSMCGYNTALDILQTGVPAVFVPFDAGGEKEQALRATALTRHPGIACLAPDSLDAQSLRESVECVLAVPARSGRSETMNGVQGTAEILARRLEEHR